MSKAGQDKTQDRTREIHNGSSGSNGNNGKSLNPAALERVSSILIESNPKALLAALKLATKELERALEQMGERRRELEILQHAMHRFLATHPEYTSRHVLSEEKPPPNIADATAMILTLYSELDLETIQAELEKRWNIRTGKKNLRTILDRWLKGRRANPKFKRTKPSTYALLKG